MATEVPTEKRQPFWKRQGEGWVTLALALMSLSFVLVARSTWAAVIGAVIAAAALSAVGYSCDSGGARPTRSGDDDPAP